MTLALPAKLRVGYCPICKGPTVFVSRYTWLRDHYRCLRCKSIPRFRALIVVLEKYFPNWRELDIHESSPGGASSDMIARECASYIATHYFPEVTLGTVHWGYRCENLENQTFNDQSFHLVITQDVLEHVLNPERAFREIARTLRPGGGHVFTVPWYSGKKTVVRAKENDGQIEYLLPPEYHGNPISEKGSLVVREWGYDLADFIRECSGMVTTAVLVDAPQMGIDAEFLEVFISRKVD
jgi:hypothetical protein